MILATCALMLTQISGPALTRTPKWAIREASERHVAITLEIVGVSSPRTVKVALKNSSTLPVQILEESNSWGAARWRVMRFHDGTLQILYQSLTGGFTVNVPRTHTLPPGGSQQVVLDLGAEEWRASGGNAMTLEQGDLVIVTYDVPFSQEASRAWYGVVGAATTVR